MVPFEYHDQAANYLARHTSWNRESVQKFLDNAKPVGPDFNNGKCLGCGKTRCVYSYYTKSTVNFIVDLFRGKEVDDFYYCTHCNNSWSVK